MDLVENWLRSIGLDEHVEAFRSERIEIEQLPDLTEADLRELGLTIGERKRFRRAVTERPPGMLNETRPNAAKLAAMVQGERRPLTMMFIDMVNSVGLSEQVGDEDVLDLIRAYRDFCGTAIARTGGHIARFVGDGILAYFCYPIANENDPQRAVRAGLEIVRGIGALPTLTGKPLQARIGIATGSVIVSDIFDGGAADMHSVSGSAPNLAARLQSFAPPNGIIIADETHDRVATLFTCADLGFRTIRGLSTEHHCWQVLGESDPAARIRGPGGAMLPVRGREIELRTLDQHWESASRGNGRVVLLSGEPGVGKSYLAERFLASNALAGDTVVTLAGSELDQDNPFYPVAAYLQAQAAEEAETAVWLDRLAGALCDLQSDREEALALVTRMAGLPTDPALLSNLTPEQARERSLEALVEILLAPSRQAPTCILVEDVHWMDPSTMELLSRLVLRLRETMVLLLLTARPAFDAPWLHDQTVTKLVVGRLRPEDMQAMIRDLLGTLAIPATLMARIIERTDGIPLFLHEILRSVRLAARSASGPSGDYGGETEIPASLQESLMARLDRAGAAKIVAQAASAIGRSVSRQVLAAVVEMDDAELTRCLHTLVEGGILVCERGPSGPTLTFSHALVRDIAYQSLLRPRLRSLHARIVTALETLEPEVAQTQPAIMALHLTEAGQMRRAAALWLEAGKQSLGTSALTEATRLFRRGLAALETAAPSPEVTTLQLELLGILGPALMALHGPGATETQKHYERAYALCQSKPEEPSHFPLYWGWWRVAEDYHTMGERSARLLSRAEARGDRGFLMQAHHCNWASHYHMGHFGRCCEHIEAGMKIYAEGDWRHHAPLFGNHDARACAHGELALVHWMQGRPATAAHYHRQSLDWAIALNHLGSLVHSMDFALTFHVMRRRHSDVFEAARELSAFTTQHALRDHAAKGQIYRGWTIATREDPVIGLRFLQEGFAMQKDIGTTEDFPIYVCLLAEALMAADQPERAVDELVRARAQFDEIGLRVWLPEVLRTTAEAMLAADPASTDPAMALMSEANRITLEQDVPMLGLRIAASHSRLLIRNGALEEAAKALTSALAKIESTDGGTDVIAARALLTELRERLGLLPAIPPVRQGNTP